jgi:SAM-dependent methyltransferase
MDGTAARHTLWRMTCSRPHAPDGSPIELYEVLPSWGEPEIVHEAIPPSAQILELGCGAGRLTHRLLDLGHPVVAVDQSPEMLARVRGAETILADIEGLELGRTFPVVLLASHFINEADQDRRRAFLETCLRHVASDGVVIVQRLSPADDDGEPGEPTVVGPVEITLTDMVRNGSVFSAVARYRAGDRVWLQPFTSEVLDDEAVEEELAGVGLVIDRWLDEARRWFTARRAT